MPISVSTTVATDSPSQAVIETIAEREGVEPMDLSVPLYEAIDPDALDTLIQDTPKYRESTPRVEFTYYGYDLTVTANGLVQVSGDN